MAANGNVLRITTGQDDWSGGVDSDKPPTIASQSNPNGLRPNQLAWLNNATIRGGGISPRPGWQRLLAMPVAAGARWGEAIMYETSGLPYIVAMIEGRIYAVRVDLDNSVEDVSAKTGLSLPYNELPFMCQGEQFVIIQAGDYSTLPLFYWDETTPQMRRSAGAGNVLGILAADFVVPDAGTTVLVTLTSPFQGDPNGVVFIGGETFQASQSGNFINVEVVTPPPFYYPGSVIAAGAIFQTRFASTPAHKLITTTVADFVVPVQGVPVTVAVDPAYGGTVPKDVSLFDKFGGYGDGPNADNGFQANTSEWWRITGTSLPPAGPNQVYLTNLSATAGATIKAGTQILSPPEIPAAGPMDYYMGRLWYGGFREYGAGDIVGGPSGSQAFRFTDSILKVSENTYITLGGAFIVPDVGGNIRAIKHGVSLDTARAEGKLFVFTLPRIYSVNVVPTRAEWKNLSEPIQRVAQINFGTSSDRSVVAVNGDLFMQTPAGVNTVIEALRYFEQWGNLPISTEEARAINLNNRALLKFSSGISFDNRIIQTCLPEQSPVGTIHKGMLPLNFDVISTLQQKLPPAWEGVWEGMNVLRLLKGDFGGRERAFAFVYAEDTKQIELWELTSQAQFDENSSGETRVEWVVEFPSYNAGKPFDLKELETLELWIDRLYGTVEFRVEFRPDQHPCWEYWHAWKECAPRNNCEDVYNVFPNPNCYPTQIYQPQYIATVILPKPPTSCEVSQGRPINLGYGFQVRIFITGYCRIRGVRMHLLPRDKAPFEKIACGDRQPANTPAAMKTIEDTRTRA